MPTANIIKSDATRYEIPGTQQMKGEYGKLERRPASVDYPNMSKSEQRDIDYGRMKNEWLAKVSYEDHGFYSDAERGRQVHSLGYDMVTRPGYLNKNYGKTYELPKEEPKPKTTQIKNTSVGGKQIKALKKGSPAKNDVRKMKRAAKKEDKAKMKAKRKAGTLDSSDFAHQSYRTLKGKF